MNIIEALRDPLLLGSAIKDATTFRSWFAVLKSIFGLPLSDDEAKLYRSCTGRSDVPQGAFGTVWLIIGRRGGKSLVMAFPATGFALWHDMKYEPPVWVACLSTHPNPFQASRLHPPMPARPGGEAAVRSRLAPRDQVRRLSRDCPQVRRAGAPMGSHNERLVEGVHTYPGCCRASWTFRAPRCRKRCIRLREVPSSAGYRNEKGDFSRGYCCVCFDIHSIGRNSASF